MRLGFRPGRVNGYMTRQTRQAIQRYQWHHDLDPNGNVSDPLLKHIRKQVVFSLERQGPDNQERSRSE
jgi:peptidoglycan hydrolase-like protein with peptidoglycan-binding domain